MTFGSPGSATMPVTRPVIDCVPAVWLPDRFESTLIGAGPAANQRSGVLAAEAAPWPWSDSGSLTVRLPLIWSDAPAETSVAPAPSTRAVTATLAEPVVADGISSGRL